MNFVLSRFGSRNRSRPCSGKLFTMRLDSYSSGATDRLIQLNIDTILNELNQLLNTSANTADDGMAGKRCLLSLSNLIRDNPDCIYVQRAEQAVLAARCLSAFDGEGAFRAVLEHLEIGIWSSQNEGWSHIEILDFLKSIKNLDTTAVSCVLVALIWPLIRASESLDAENLGFVIHVVSSLGISHPALSAAILSRACTLISEMSIGSLCQILIATEGHDNSKLINAMHEKLSATVDTVSAQTLSQCYSVLHKQPLSTEGGAPTALLERMHLRACKVVEEANLDDIVELLRQSSRVQSKTMFSVTVEKALARVVKQKNNLLPEHITSLSQSLHTHNLVNEEMLAAVAERACRVVALFQPEQMAIVLNVFSSFNLYDPELFPLFALRLQHMTRQKILVDSDHVAVMIDSFARLQEKNEPLLYSAVAQLKVGMPTISPEIAKKCLDAFRTLNFNHEIVSALENRLVTHTQQ